MFASSAVVELVRSPTKSKYAPWSLFNVRSRVELSCQLFITVSLLLPVIVLANLSIGILAGFESKWATYVKHVFQSTVYCLFSRSPFYLVVHEYLRVRRML